MKEDLKKTKAAILFSDIVGYTALMGEDQDLAFELVNKNLKVHQEILAKYNGKLIKELGDGILCSFTDSYDAVVAAYELQKHYLRTKELSLRIGIHYGEVILDRNDVFGDAVNIASRIQTLGLPGSVLFSKEIKEDIRESSTCKVVSKGHFKLKNVKEPIEIYALANEGLKIPKRGEMLKLLESRLRKFMVVAVIFLAVCLIGFLIYHNSYVKQFNETEIKSIAILPFFDNENSSVNDSLNLDLTDNLINGLSSISSFGIIDISSSKQYNIQNHTVSTICKELRAKYLVVGNSSRNGEKRIINIKLFEGDRNKMLWTEDFEIGYEMLDVLEFNRQITIQISNILGVKLTVSELERLNSNPTESSDAYHAYLSGRKKFLKYEEATNQEAIKDFRKALRLSPNFKEAYQGLADAFVQNHIYSDGDNYWLDSSIYYSNAALKIDNSYSEVYVSLGSASYYKVDYPAAINYFKKAISISNNNPRALANLGSTLMVLGKIDSSLFYLDKSAKLNPQSFISLQNVGWNYRLLKDYHNAICWLEESIKIKPSIISYEQLAYSYIGLNDFETPKVIAEIILNLEDDEKKMREVAGMIYFLCRDFEAAYLNFNMAYQSDHPQINCGANGQVIYLGYLEKVINKNIFKSEILVDGCKVYLDSNIQEKSQDFEIYFDMVVYNAIKGDRQNCLKSLKLAEDHYWVDVLFLSHNPIFEIFKNHPEFKKSIKDHNSKIDIRRKNAQNMNVHNINSGIAALSVCYK